MCTSDRSEPFHHTLIILLDFPPFIIFFLVLMVQKGGKREKISVMVIFCTPYILFPFFINDFTLNLLVSGFRLENLLT